MTNWKSTVLVDSFSYTCAYSFGTSLYTTNLQNTPNSIYSCYHITLDDRGNAMSSYRVLKDDREFFVAALSESRVTIFHNGQLIDYGGCIEKYTNMSIKIEGTYYFRSQYEFRVMKIK